MIASSKRNYDEVRTFEFKGRMLTLTVINILSEDLDLLGEQLSQKISQAPDFFIDSPVVIDLKDFDEISLKEVVSIIKERELVPIGVIGGGDAINSQAKELGIGLFPQLKVASTPKSDKQSTSEKSEAESEVSKEQEQNIQSVEDNGSQQVASDVVEVESESGKTPSLLIKQPVRSGQQIYAKGGDLVIMSSVGAGAEVLADGHIHVYGSLRGRALAGVRGDSEARIFCHSLNAELVSVAGHYQISDDIPKDVSGGGAQIYLRNDQLIVEKL